MGMKTTLWLPHCLLASPQRSPTIAQKLQECDIKMQEICEGKNKRGRKESGRGQQRWEREGRQNEAEEKRRGEIDGDNGVGGGDEAGGNGGREE